MVRPLCWVLNADIVHGRLFGIPIHLLILLFNSCLIYLPRLWAGRSFLKGSFTTSFQSLVLGNLRKLDKLPTLTQVCQSAIKIACVMAVSGSCKILRTPLTNEIRCLLCLASFYAVKSIVYY
jgi:hypothetical protein